jgi:hypothetical protein
MPTESRLIHEVHPAQCPHGRLTHSRAALSTPCGGDARLSILRVSMLKRFKEPLSFLQVILATGILVVLAGGLYGAYCGLTALWHRRMLKQTIPATLAGLRAQREEVTHIIEAYKGRFGFYPPMSTAPGPKRGVINPLCYELLGLRFDKKRSEFFIPASKDPLTVGEAQKYFNVQTFSNCLEFPEMPTNFMADRPVSVQPLAADSDLFGVGVSYTQFVPESFWYDYEFSAWRYTTNPAEHNPGKFDLWVEMNVAGKHFVVGNWPEVN